MNVDLRIRLFEESYTSPDNKVDSPSDFEISAWKNKALLGESNEPET